MAPAVRAVPFCVLGVVVATACAKQSGVAPIGADLSDAGSPAAEVGLGGNGGSLAGVGRGGNGGSVTGLAGAAGVYSAGTAGVSGALTGRSGSNGVAGGSAGEKGGSNGGTGGSVGGASGGTSGTGGSVSGSSGGVGGTGGSIGGSSGGVGGAVSNGGGAGSGGGAACTEQALTLQCARDSSLNAAATTSNYGHIAEVDIVRGGATASQRAVLWFDLSVLPVGVTLRSASLRVVVLNDPGSDKTLAVHRISQNSNRAWSETDVTWLSYQASANWTNAGGDWVPQASDSKLVVSGTAAGSVLSFSVLPDAQNFYAMPGSNYGWLIKDSLEPAASTGEQIYLGTRENADVASRPTLVLSYCP